MINHSNSHNWIVLAMTDADMLVVPIEQRDAVRDYIEKLVATMLDGGESSLDHVPIGQLNNRPSCTYHTHVFVLRCACAYTCLSIYIYCSCRHPHILCVPFAIE